MKNTKLALFLFLIGAIFVCFAPFIFTLPGRISFTETGTIGDTIGGITAPITSLIGSLLVYFALKAQIDANQIIQAQIKDQKDEEIARKKLQYLSDQVAMIRNDINDFSFYHVRISSQDQDFMTVKETMHVNAFKGPDAISRFADEIMDGRIVEDHPKALELHDLLLLIEGVYNKIEQAAISKEDKLVLKTELAYHFNSKVKHAFTSNKSRNPRSNGLLHRQLFELVLRIAAR